ncbi:MULTISPECIES: gephyrin-like molybdotransferase receptor GlpR [unclassified Streptomyces]|uniref:divisome protein SepX/GlpR n=1 Tax=unclassified Streptomyces TaxID=2593676 RepID=UPI0004BFB9BC|nr:MULTISPECIES: gephyrin-like molybdotransferase receptor GlpR [unclassified Streptomyces]
MSSSGLIYAVIVGAWAAYLVPMWLRRQDELNEARPTERFSTAIRLLSGRAGMERRYARDLRARSADESERDADPDDVTASVDVRAFAMPPAGQRAHTRIAPAPQRSAPVPPQQGARPEPSARPARPAPTPQQEAPERHSTAPERHSTAPERHSAAPERQPAARAASRPVPGARRAQSAEALARARRSKVLARRRRTTVMLFLAFTLGAIVAAVGGLAFLWVPAVPAVLLSGYIAYLRAQERKRFAYQMDRQRAEVAAQRLRERRPRQRPAALDADTDEPEDGPEPATDPGLSALAADRRALVEQTDHAEWVDQQRERQRRPGHGDSWDPVPVPLPTYVTAPVAPRATPHVDLSAPDTWSAARSSAADPDTGTGAHRDGGGRPREARDRAARPESAADTGPAEEKPDGASADRSDARRAASARRSRGRGRTPLFDQYEDTDRPRAANE